MEAETQTRSPFSGDCQGLKTRGRAESSTGEKEMSPPPSPYSLDSCATVLEDLEALDKVLGTPSKVMPNASQRELATEKKALSFTQFKLAEAEMVWEELLDQVLVSERRCEEAFEQARLAQAAAEESAARAERYHKERDAAVKERDQAVREGQRLLAERDKAIRSRDRVLLEGMLTQQQHEAMLQARVASEAGATQALIDTKLCLAQLAQEHGERSGKLAARCRGLKAQLQKTQEQLASSEALENRTMLKLERVTQQRDLLIRQLNAKAEETQHRALDPGVKVR
ncbi:unnamed protein product [Chrysoparadoxa australica]